MKSFKCIIMCALIAAASFTAVGCSDDKKSESNGNAMVNDGLGEDVNVAEEDLPYGATQTKLTSKTDNVPITIEYDDRFLTADEALLISNYFSAINDKDGALLRTCYYDGYADYYASVSGSTDADAYAISVHDSVQTDTIGSEYNFSYILTEDCIKSTDEGATNYYFDDVDFYLDSYAKGINDTELLNKISSRKVVTLDVMFDTDEGNFSLANRLDYDLSLYIYTIDGKSYIC